MSKTTTLVNQLKKVAIYLTPLTVGTNALSEKQTRQAIQISSVIPSTVSANWVMKSQRWRSLHLRVWKVLVTPFSAGLNKSRLDQTFRRTSISGWSGFGLHNFLYNFLIVIDLGLQCSKRRELCNGLQRKRVPCHHSTQPHAILRTGFGLHQWKFEKSLQENDGQRTRAQLEL